MISGLLVLGTISDGYAEFIPNISDQPGPTYTYSIVHLSDTQNLASYYPDTYNHTFTYLDSLKSQYNISAIIITGDLVNNYDNLTEWQTYANAINKTSIPIYVTAGNHDTNAGKDDRNYDIFTGSSDRYYLTTVNDFNLVGISYVKKTLPSSDLQQIKTFLETSPYQVTIIATHYYMDPDGEFSRLGRSINQDLVVGPTILMTGHKHVYSPYITRIQVGSYPVIEDLADFQDGIKG
ncbi:MAG: metallophosphoesterase, partial [Methanospirillum sp.]|uniref:metallophosphoesterase family protein n=1 Tax=Methanospirillum sp. TaxID=45200 RepID=UPI00236DA235